MNSRPALLASNLLPSVKSRLRDAARWVRYLPDRIFHPYRRRRAREALRDLAPATRSFVFLCYGNICRSPFAAELFRQVLDGTGGLGDVSVSSSGFHPVGGRRPPREAVQAARERGIDLSDHRSSVLSSLSMGRDELRDHRFLFFVMDAGQRERLVRSRGVQRGRVFVLGDLDPEVVARRRILDPYGKSLDTFHGVYDRIQRCVGELASLTTARSPAEELCSGAASAPETSSAEHHVNDEKDG